MHDIDVWIMFNIPVGSKVDTGILGDCSRAVPLIGGSFLDAP